LDILLQLDQLVKISFPGGRSDRVNPFSSPVRSNSAFRTRRLAIDPLEEFLNALFLPYNVFSTFNGLKYESD
jgi:hypothetical protein